MLGPHESPQSEDGDVESCCDLPQAFEEGVGLETSEPQNFEETLLRAVPLRSILSRFGHVLVGSNGSEKTFQKSKPSQRISMFLSHSWSTPGYSKALGLMYVGNVRRACFISWAVAIGLFISIATTDVGETLRGPGDLYFAGTDTIRKAPTIIAGIFPNLLFLIILVFGQNLPLGETSCFLDKCCIHQTDVVKKREGVKLLSRFLQISDKLMILYHPDYMTRLWCVYELAAFRHLRGNVEGSIQFLPLRVPMSLLAMFVVHTFSGIAVQLAGPFFLSKSYAEWVMRESPSDWIPLYYFATSTLTFLLGFAVVVPAVFRSFQSHIRDNVTLLRQLREFELSQTSCLFPSDREFVEGQIVKWFGSISNFEQVVRTDVADSVEKQVQSQVPLRWKPAASTALPHIFILMMHGALYLRKGEWGFAVTVLLFAATYTCCSSTIPIALMFRWLRFLRHSTCGKVAYALLIHLSFVLFAAFSLILVSPAAPPWLMALVVLTQALITIWFYWCPSEISPLYIGSVQKSSRLEKELVHSSNASIIEGPDALPEFSQSLQSIQKAYDDDELSWN
mmetsp:Transcript_1074/g.2340  ORF Transcript_1074/g.2340 Transcript_1074/m.2340 type:complete len:564 (+) Transcript_1074:109-1800(+)